MAFIEKTYEDWLEEFSSYKDCSTKMIAISSLKGAMSRKEWESTPGINKRYYNDMMDTNEHSRLQNLYVKFVKITGRPAKYFFFYPDKKFPKVPDKVLRPSVPNDDNTKTGRSWKYNTQPLAEWEQIGKAN